MTAQLPCTLLRAVLRLAEANFALGALLVNVAARWRQTVQRRPPPLQDGDQTIGGGALKETQMGQMTADVDLLVSKLEIQISKGVFFKDEI